MTQDDVSKGGFRGLAKQLLAGFVLCATVVAAGLTWVTSSRAAATPPNIVAYEGRLLNSNGVPLADASASMIFELYTALSGGSCVWSNSSATCASATARTVTLTSGLFSENLGDTAAATPYPAISNSVFGDNAALYLQVTVGGETLTPRKQIVSAPYAINASLLDGLDSTQAGGTTALVLALDTSGNLQLTGSPQGTGVTQGALVVNPALGVVAANEILFGVAVGAASRFSVDGEGDVAIQGDAAITGGDITSSSALAISSSGGDISLGPNGSGLAYITAGDDFAVGAASVVAPFAVIQSTNTVRIGDGADDTNAPSLIFYASDATDLGTLSYTDQDLFDFSGGNVVMSGLGAVPTLASSTLSDFTTTSSFSGTSDVNLSTIEMYSAAHNTTYSAIENGTGTDHYAGSLNSLLTISGTTATLTRGYATRSKLTNTSTNASLVQGSGYLAATESELVHNAAATTVANAYGMHSILSSVAGTITSGSGVFGEIGASVGTVTTGYAGRFVAAGGTNRYGVYGEASGGTANYAGYFTGAAVQIDGDSTPDVPTYATTAGELYVAGDLESRGSTSFGDTTGTDQFLFTSAVATVDAITVNTDSLTTGNALAISRAAGGSPVDGSLLTLSQLNSDAASDGDVLSLVNNAAGGSVGIRVLQNTLSAHADNVINNNMLVLDTNDAASSDDAMIIRSDVDGTPDTEFRVESDGDVFGDGAAYTSGADYAEFFKTSDASLGDYQIVCQDPSASESVRRCPAGDTTYVMGVVSTNAAFVGNNFRGASHDMSNDADYRKIGMVGQIETLVNAQEGAIAIGDPITTSSSLVGYGAKSVGPSRIVGFALEPLASGTGTIRVLVQPQWYGGTVFTAVGSVTNVGSSVVMAPLGLATSGTPAIDSHDLELRGSAWMSDGAVNRAMSIATSVSTADDYRLVVRNDDGTEAAYISNDGDLALAGRLYPSDRGSLQHDRYIYYDGSSGGAGDFMRTNASGWATGSYDFAEMFPSPDHLSPGEVVVFGDTNTAVKRSLGETYAQGIAGIVSTRPGFLAGENTAGNYPIALAGRVPTYVTAENGSIAIGDPLTTSSKAGYAMKATEAGPILGYATEPFTGSVGSIVVYVNVSYFDGDPSNDAPAAQNVVSTLATPASLFDASGALNVNGGSILSIGSLQGIGGNWRLEEDGDFVTHGRVVQVVRSHQGEDVETYAAASRQMTIELSGTATLEGGMAVIAFEDIDPLFNDIISPTSPYRVLLTPYAATGTLYVAQRTATGFVIQEKGSSGGVLVDWLVLAPHKDYEPVVTDPSATAVEDILVPVLEVPEESVPTGEAQVEVVTEPEPVVDEPVSDPVAIEEAPAPSTDTASTEVLPDVTIAEPEPTP